MLADDTKYLAKSVHGIIPEENRDSGMRLFNKGSQVHALTSLLVLSLVSGLLAACNSGATPTTAQPSITSTITSGAPSATPTGASSGPSSTVIRVVAAENFWGDIVKQIGGDHVSVTSILSDPNIDPHEYEANVQNGVDVTKAQMVIENGGGYDDWMGKLLSASPNPNRVLLIAFDMAPTKLPDNEHVFYSIDDARAIAQSIADASKKQDSADASSFDSNLKTFDAALAEISKKIDEIKAGYSGTNVGLTETIFLYQTGPLGLNVLTPLEFEKAVAEGNDPPADAVIAANDQITGKQIKVLVYNSQTVTPITDNLKSAASSRGIPLVPVTEMMPPSKNYQTWMLDQLDALERALGEK